MVVALDVAAIVAAVVITCVADATMISVALVAATMSYVIRM